VEKKKNVKGKGLAPREVEGGAKTLQKGERKYTRGQQNWIQEGGGGYEHLLYEVPINRYLTEPEKFGC